MVSVAGRLLGIQAACQEPPHEIIEFSGSRDGYEGVEARRRVATVAARGIGSGVDPFDASDVPGPLERWLPAGATLVFPEQGMTSNVAFIAPGEAVFKRCVDPLYLEWLRRERMVLEALADTEVAAPRVLDYLDLGSEVWLAMTRLPGRQAAEALIECDRQSRLELLQVLGGAVRRLHETPVPHVLRPEESWIDLQLAAAQSNLSWCDGSAELLEQLRNTLPKARAEALVHGDLNLENVLVCDGAVSGFVDWAAGASGDPRCDVALALLSDDDLTVDDEMSAAFFSGYGGAATDAERRWFEGLYEFF